MEFLAFVMVLWILSKGGEEPMDKHKLNLIIFYIIADELTKIIIKVLELIF